MGELPGDPLPHLDHVFGYAAHGPTQFVFSPMFDLDLISPANQGNLADEFIITINPSPTGEPFGLNGNFDVNAEESLLESKVVRKSHV